MQKQFGMAFQTYQCEQYIKYLNQHEKQIQAIYQLLQDSPFEWTYLGAQIGMNYPAFRRKFQLRRLTNEQLIVLLNIVK